MIKNPLTRALLSSLEAWIEHVIQDESVGFAEASEMVIAKMHNETAQSKRQRMDYDRTARVFRVVTEYEIDHGTNPAESKSVAGVPHTEVLPFGAVKTGCIVFTRDAITRLYQLTHQEPGYVHEGYMRKGLKK